MSVRQNVASDDRMAGSHRAIDIRSDFKRDFRYIQPTITSLVIQILSGQLCLTAEVADSGLKQGRTGTVRQELSAITIKAPWICDSLMLIALGGIYRTMILYHLAGLMCYDVQVGVCSKYNLAEAAATVGQRVPQRQATSRCNP